MRTASPSLAPARAESTVDSDPLQAAVDVLERLRVGEIRERDRPRRLLALDHEHRPLSAHDDTLGLGPVHNGGLTRLGLLGTGLLYEQGQNRPRSSRIPAPVTAEISSSGSPLPAVSPGGSRSAAGGRRSALEPTTTRGRSRSSARWRPELVEQDGDLF